MKEKRRTWNRKFGERIEREVDMQVMAAVKELKKGNWRSMRGEEWKEWNRLIFFQDRIYVPKDAKLCR